MVPTIDSTLKRRRVVVIHSFLDGREHAVASGDYPRHQLWGIDSLQQAGWQVTLMPHSSGSRLLTWLSGVLGSRFGNIAQEWPAIRAAREADAVYSVSGGDLFFMPLLRRLRLFRPKVVTWRYTAERPAPIWKWSRVRQSSWLLRGIDGVLCLTANAERAFARQAPRSLVRQVDWGVDSEMFQPATNVGEFFLCCGKTERDFPVLFGAAARVAHPIRLVVPRAALPPTLPQNVTVEDGPASAADDRGIGYRELRDRLYANAIAFLIPLVPHDNNASGFTNLLEAFAMGKPVIMTRTGCLDIDIEAEGVGIYVNPGDEAGWAIAMNALVADRERTRAMGQRARCLVDRHYSYEAFGHRLTAFFDEL